MKFATNRPLFSTGSAVLLIALGAVLLIGVGRIKGTVRAARIAVATSSPTNQRAPMTTGPRRVGRSEVIRTSKAIPSRAIHGLPGLHVQGRYIVDSHGKSLRLIGVNRSASEFKCIQLGTSTSLGWGIFDGPVDMASARSIAAWHTNTVRIPLNEDCWLGINHVSPRYGGAAYRIAIKRYVHVLHRVGLYVILDLHWNAPGKARAASQQPMPDLDHSPAFWKSVATTFKHDPNVVFDLYNEPFLYTSYLVDPNEDFWTCWRDGCTLNQYLTGGTPYTKGHAWKAAGMQTLVNAVRGTGASNLILVAGLDWANDVSGWATNAPFDPVHNMAVSWHSYPGETCSQETCWSQIVAPLARKIPVVVGETGDNVCSSATYDPTFLPWADLHNLSYLGWTWNTWQDCKNILIKDYGGTPTGHYGQYFHDHLTKVAKHRGSAFLQARPLAAVRP
jgi:endoglucanase